MIETKELKGKISSDNKIQGGNTAVSGPQGKEGLSAYEVSVKNGFEGTEEEWLKTLKGEKGDQGEQGIQGEKGEQGEQGIQGIQGVPGKDFSIYKTYPSIVEMEADKDNVEEGNFVMIASNVEDVDNSKLYVKGSTDFVYLTDLSGATGMKGEQGPQGIQGEQGIQGPKGEQGEVSLEQLNILQAKTIKCLQEVETPTPVSGESINLSDSADAKIDELKISGNSKQETRSGKNKFIPLKEGTNSGITITKNVDGTYNITGTSTATNTIEHTGFVDLDKSEIKNGSTYIVSSTKALPEGLSSRIEMYSGATWLRQFVPSINSTIATNTGVANTSDATRIRFGIFILAGTTVNIQNLGFQLEEGTIATDYEPYGASPSPDYPSEVESCGDNINILNPANSENYTISNDGSLYRENTRLCTDFIPVNLNDNEFAFYTNTVLMFYGVAFYNDNKEYISRIYRNGGKEFIFTKPDNAKYLRVFIQVDGSAILNSNSWDYYKAKLEKGSTKTGYSPYGQGCINEVIDNGLETTDTNYKSQAYTIPTQQPFRAIGDIRDTFIKKNNKWFERHYIKRLILNGTETYGSYTNTKGLLVCYLTSSNLLDYKQGDIKSNYFTETKTVIGEENKNCIFANTNNIQFINTNVTTIDEFKAWLTSQYNAGTPVYVDYILETPLDNECTEEQSTILFDIEQNAKTYDKVTHIYSTDEVSPNVEVTYKKDIETLFSNTLVS